MSREARATRAGAELAAEFLEQLRPPPWLLCAIDPVTREIHTVEAWTRSDVIEFVNQWNGKRNLYYHLNPVKPGLSTHAKKEDVIAAEFIHADLDPLDDETPEQAIRRYLTAIGDFGVEPSAIILSGNGLNVLWRLDHPLPPQRFGKVEAVNRATSQLLGGLPGTQDVSRLLRLPGTINLPNKKKRKLGRRESLASAVLFGEYGEYLVRPSSHVQHPLSAFPTLIDLRNAERQPGNRGARKTPEPPADLMQIIREGVPHGNRSDAFFGVVAKLKQYGYSAAAIEALLRQYPNGIAAKYEGRLLAEIERAYNKPDGVRRIGTGQPELTPLAMIQRREPEFLWLPFIPRAELTLVYGEGAVGKTTFTMDIAARVTVGDSFPLDTRKAKRNPAAPGSVIIISGEDEPGYLSALVQASGGDPKRVHMFAEKDRHTGGLDQIDDLQANLHRLDDEVQRLGDVELIIISPVNDFVNNVNTWSDVEARRWLKPLRDLARRHNLALILITHMNKKTDQSARGRAMGSVAFVNVPRSAVLVAKDHHNPDRRLVVLEKSNLVSGGNCAIAFRLINIKGVPRVEWEDEWLNISADDALRNSGDTKQSRTVEWLREFLSEGQRLASDIESEAKRLDITRATLVRAKKNLKIRSNKVAERWYWSLRKT